MKPVHLTISERVRDDIDFTSIEHDDKCKKWIDEYNKFNLGEKLDFIAFFDRCQSLYIRYAMDNLISPISVPKLGTFFYKEARKEYHDLKRDNPDLSEEEIISKVRENYYIRKNSKKSKTISISIKK